MNHSEEIRALFTLARKDEKYAALVKGYLMLEEEFGEIAKRLSAEE